jgi:hypothetical protein
MTSKDAPALPSFHFQFDNREEAKVQILVHKRTRVGYVRMKDHHLYKVVARPMSREDKLVEAVEGADNDWVLVEDRGDANDPVARTLREKDAVRKKVDDFDVVDAEWDDCAI